MNICRCSVCGLEFTSEGPFDFHRVGKLHPRDPALDERRCRTPEEMREKGYEPNSRGRWRKPVPDVRFRSESAS